MSKNTKIQWADDTVNPISGCKGCELWPSPAFVLHAIDDAIRVEKESWNAGQAKEIYEGIIQLLQNEIGDMDKPFDFSVSNTNIYQLREEFGKMIEVYAGESAAEAALTVIADKLKCYAARLTCRYGLSLAKPDRTINTGLAPTFEQATRFPGRMMKAAKASDMLGTKDEYSPWKDGLPRLIFVGDMGDIFAREDDFEYLENEMMPAIQSEEGKRHLWLILTKRPNLMAKFAERIGGFPENVCAMTTITGPQLNRVDQLREVQAYSRGLSVEPLWERIPPEELNLEGIDWVILGGESGDAKDSCKPFDVAWAHDLIEHCNANGVAVFVKQLGGNPIINGQSLQLTDSHGGDWNEWEGDLRVRDFPSYFHEYRADQIPADPGLRYPVAVGLSDSDKSDFERLHHEVKEGGKVFVRTAKALFEIRERKLYREKFETFREYCLSVQELSPAYANRLIKAAEVIVDVSTPIGVEDQLPTPANEAQCRELARLKEPEQRRLAYQTAIEKAEEGQPVTAQVIRIVVDNLLPSKGQESGVKKARKLSAEKRLKEALDELEVLEQAIAEEGEVEESLQRLKAILANRETSEREAA